jgi:hypothetical protein
MVMMTYDQGKREQTSRHQFWSKHLALQVDHKLIYVLIIGRQVSGTEERLRQVIFEYIFKKLVATFWHLHLRALGEHPWQ